jgi:hypothetical protein
MKAVSAVVLSAVLAMASATPLEKRQGISSLVVGMNGEAFNPAPLLP